MSDSPYIFEGTGDNFDHLVIQASMEKPVLVDFWAAWCQPCQMLMPIVTSLAESYDGKFHLVKVNSDEQQQLAAVNGVRSLPTLKLFHKGQVVEEIMGAQPETVLREMLDKYIGRESDKLVDQARLLVQADETEKARTLLQQALQDDPDNDRIHLELARLAVLTGDMAGAQAMLDELPVSARETDEAKQLGAQIRFASTIQDGPEPAELEARITQDPSDLSSRQILAAWRALEGNYEGAMEQYLEIMKRDRNWQDDAGRKGMLDIFDLLGGEGELVSRYRRQMFNLLH